MQKFTLETVETTANNKLEQRLSNREMELNQREVRIEAREKQQDRRQDYLQEKEIQLLQKEVDIKKKEQEVKGMLRKMEAWKEITNLPQVNFEIMKLQLKKDSVEQEIKHWEMVKSKEEQQWKQ